MSEKKFSKQTRAGLLSRAREMRSKPSEAEAMLWRAIRFRQLGEVKFRRQHLIGAYIVDFYSPKAKLVIEVDGPVHLNQQEYDQARSDELMAKGYTLLRFKNEEVMKDIDSVLIRIKEELLV